MISARIAKVQDPVIPIIGRWTRESPGTISLGQGVVHYSPPDQVFAAVSEAAVGDRTLDRYGDVVGEPTLTDLIAEKLERENAIQATGDGASVICSAGANMGFLNAILAIGDVGDEIILLGPYYFNHHMAIEIAGCRPVVVPTTSEDQPDLQAIKRAMSDKTRAVVTVSPNNPTGAVYSSETLREINALCAQRGIFHISDEAYEYFLYDGAEHFSPGSLPGASAHTISLFSLSKAYGLAGWRIGYSVVPDPLVDAVRKIQDTNLICPPKVCQVAAAAALQVGASWCHDRIAKLAPVRQASLDALASLSDRCEITVPRGAFYLFLKLQSDHHDLSLVQSLIRDEGVAVLPGSAFGHTDGCSLRASYGALDADSVLEGIGRLQRGLARIL
ncbi:pyridoxal phosphate-dependent aminotransferase [Roseiconus nitratireducens]|uniref:Aminotransferase n=1 Tax=Roseiconus nitratireducens TaxID=2605748 RepID=A0A5M6D6J9_9BACT|nr:pyridoxal phosphate-dependent aminotransferase [Roseiconus nitratireducens]KAA5543158.1 pyridoxal phosphate-dependent aminotransferase [Roseiconus nitratireducens]